MLPGWVACLLSIYLFLSCFSCLSSGRGEGERGEGCCFHAAALSPYHLPPHLSLLCSPHLSLHCTAPATIFLLHYFSTLQKRNACTAYHLPCLTFYLPHAFSPSHTAFSALFPYTAFTFLPLPSCIVCAYPLTFSPMLLHKPCCVCVLLPYVCLSSLSLSNSNGDIFARAFHIFSFADFTSFACLFVALQHHAFCTSLSLFLFAFVIHILALLCLCLPLVLALDMFCGNTNIFPCLPPPPYCIFVLGQGQAKRLLVRRSPL